MGTTNSINTALGSLAGANTAGTTGSSTTGSASIAGNFNTFLTLLTTQLQHQDPTNPTDASAFTQQLVEFAGVQQQVQTNTELQSLLTAFQSTQVSSASSFVGTTIQATGNQGALTNGTAQFGYTLPSAAANATVTITDSAGQAVFTGTGTGNTGNNLVSWNGTNSFTGATEPDGVYKISVQATDASGNAITATPYITGTVNSASISNGVVELNIGALQVPASSVTNITNLAGTKTASS